MKPLLDTELGYTKEAQDIRDDFCDFMREFIDTKSLAQYDPIQLGFILSDILADFIAGLWIEKSNELYKESGKSFK